MTLTHMSSGGTYASFRQFRRVYAVTPRMSQMQPNMFKAVSKLQTTGYHSFRTFLSHHFCKLRKTKISLKYIITQRVLEY